MRRTKNEVLAEKVMTKKNGFVPKEEVKVGMRVTCKVPEEAYYSRYAGRPERWFSPGDVGVVGAADVPKVRILDPKNGDSFVCVDFGEKNENGFYSERCSLDYNNIVLLP